MFASVLRSEAPHSHPARSLVARVRAVLHIRAFVEGGVNEQAGIWSAPQELAQDAGSDADGTGFAGWLCRIHDPQA